MRSIILSLAVFAAAASAAAQGGPPQVVVAQPLLRDVTQWDEYFGRLEAAEEVEIRPRVSGFITEKHFRDGQVVEAGSLLYSIDPRPFQIAVDAAAAEVSAAESRSALAAAEVRRAEPLRQRGNISVSAFDERRFAAREARARQEAAGGARWLGRGAPKWRWPRTRRGSGAWTWWSAWGARRLFGRSLRADVTGVRGRGGFS